MYQAQAEDLPLANFPPLPNAYIFCIGHWRRLTFVNTPLSNTRDLKAFFARGTLFVFQFYTLPPKRQLCLRKFLLTLPAPFY